MHALTMQTHAANFASNQFVREAVCDKRESLTQMHELLNPAAARDVQSLRTRKPASGAQPPARPRASPEATRKAKSPLSNAVSWMEMRTSAKYTSPCTRAIRTHLEAQTDSVQSTWQDGSWQAQALHDARCTGAVQCRGRARMHDATVVPLRNSSQRLSYSSRPTPRHRRKSTTSYVRGCVPPRRAA